MNMQFIETFLQRFTSVDITPHKAWEDFGYCVQATIAEESTVEEAREVFIKRWMELDDEWRKREQERIDWYKNHWLKGERDDSQD